MEVLLRVGGLLEVYGNFIWFLGTRFSGFLVIKVLVYGKFTISTSAHFSVQVINVWFLLCTPLFSIKLVGFNLSPSGLLNILHYSCKGANLKTLPVTTLSKHKKIYIQLKIGIGFICIEPVKQVCE